MIRSLSSTVGSVFLRFSSCFSAPSFENFTALAAGWILCEGRHSISRVIQAAGPLTKDKHHSAFYRFFSRSSWSTDSLGKVVFDLLLPHLPSEIDALVDDTLCRKGGPHIWGAGMHHDAVRSSYGKFTKATRHVAISFGHNWVVLAVSVPLPWGTARAIAVPVLFRLYRSKKLCPSAKYRKRTALAREMIDLLSKWVPEDRVLHLVGDVEYACKNVVRTLPDNVPFTGPMSMKAALYTLPPKRKKKGKGRPRKKGKRLPSPQQLASTPSVPWQKLKITIYGKTVTLRVKTMVCLWYTVAGTRLVRVVLTQDPRGVFDDRAFFCTDPKRPAEEILVRFARRWSIEVAFLHAKQLLHIEDPQNGWWRRRPRSRAPKKKAGPNPRGNRGKLAVEHTLPFSFVVYAIVVIWYLEHGNPAEDVERARAEAPWYLHKREPSFEDMLAALRRDIWASRFSANPLLKRVGGKLADLLPRWLLAA